MQLFHISETNWDGMKFYPRIPNRTMEGENKTISRICVSSNITGCIQSEASGLTYYYVHIPDGKFEVIKPSKNDVPDVKQTREYWITTPVKMKCIGLIDTSETTEKKIRWKWVKKYF